MPGCVGVANPCTVRPLCYPKPVRHADTLTAGLDDLTARERELLEEQNRRVQAHEERQRGSEPRTHDV